MARRHILSHNTPDASRHFIHPTPIWYVTWIDPRYLKLPLLGMTSWQSSLPHPPHVTLHWTYTPSTLSYPCSTLKPLGSRFWLQTSHLLLTLSFVSTINSLSSLNNIQHGNSPWICRVNSSITKTNKNKLRVNPWSNPIWKVLRVSFHSSHRVWLNGTRLLIALTWIWIGSLK